MHCLERDDDITMNPTAVVERGSSEPHLYLRWIALKRTAERSSTEGEGREKDALSKIFLESESIRLAITRYAVEAAPASGDSLATTLNFRLIYRGAGENSITDFLPKGSLHAAGKLRISFKHFLLTPLSGVPRRQDKARAMLHRDAAIFDLVDR